MSPEHKARALKIKCIDYRFEEKIDADAKSRGLNGNSDEISWPGASKDFKNVSQAVALSIKLHDPDEVIIYEHEDCGAYGQDNSEKAHRKNASKLKAFIKHSKPNMRVTTLFATSEEIKEL